MKAKKFCALIVMDGYGERKDKNGNAIAVSGSPFVKKITAEYPSTLIGASGLDVGLPDGQIGNSEVGHLNLGAGRIVYQDITRIDKSIRDGDFFLNPAFMGAIGNAKKNNSKLHLVGLVSDGGVHSSLNHLFALLKMCKANDLKKVFVHCLLDGRDVPPDSAADFVGKLEAFMTKEGVGRVASVMGRYYFMDRDNRWERVERGFNCMFAGSGNKASDAVKAVKDSYAAKVYDEFVEPTAIYSGGMPVAEVDKGDSIIFFNFRSDRAREASRAILERDFNLFVRKKGFVEDLFYVGMTQYDASFTGIHTAFGPKELKMTFGEFFAKEGYKQLRIAETEKYAHVTFFFNGGVEKLNEGETRILVPSPKVATYDMQPEMSAYEVADKAVAEIQKGEIDAMILNFANCDMVGHTGVMDAAVKAVSVVDECVKKVVGAITAIGGGCIVTADHGNAEQMVASDGGIWTAHTTNPVPCIVVDKEFAGAKLREGGTLADVIPTMLDMMGINKPAEMEGVSLIIRK